MPPKPSSKATSKYQRKGAKPPQPKKELSPEAKQLKKFRSLHSQLSTPSPSSKALKTLRSLPSSLLAFRTHLQLLISLDSYGPALSLLSEKQQWKEIALENAYCLMRVWREGEAMEALKVAEEVHEDGEYGEDRDRGVQLLKAQLAYRLGDYDTAVKQYEQLIEEVDPSSGEHSDLSSNLLASRSRLTFHNRLPDLVHLSRQERSLPPTEVLENRPVLPPAKTRAPIVPKKKAKAKKEEVKGKDGKELDPERWIPLKMRSYYVPPTGVGKRKKEKEKEKLLTQGAAEGVGNAAGGGKKKKGRR
ncbi:hypothetical protein BT69DRAFT_1300498 [Atractiella rhizophila]|nr:hypothetical protein BT69DRAFT_1300498 [Atractiella rhizophila]